MTDSINVPRPLLERAILSMKSGKGDAKATDQIRALLQAPAQPPQVQGWQMVPVEPTEEILEANK